MLIKGKTETIDWKHLNEKENAVCDTTPIIGNNRAI